MSRLRKCAQTVTHQARVTEDQLAPTPARPFINATFITVGANDVEAVSVQHMESKANTLIQLHSSSSPFFSGSPFFGLFLDPGLFS